MVKSNSYPNGLIISPKTDKSYARFKLSEKLTISDMYIVLNIYFPQSVLYIRYGSNTPASKIY